MSSIKGGKELMAFLQQMPVQFEKNVSRGMVRAAAKPVLAQAKANAKYASGELRDGLKIGTKYKNGVVTASIKAKGKHGFLALWFERGIKPHHIQGKDGKPLNIGVGFANGVDHPGVQAAPFMRPALDTEAGAALVAAAEYVKKRLTKAGLAASDIEIEEEV